MLIIGAKGFAKEVLEIFQETGNIDNLAFYDDISPDIDRLMFDKFPILRNDTEAKAFFENNGNEFTLGIGNPHIRKKLSEKFDKLGGKLVSIISPSAILGSYDVQIGEGSNVLPNATFSNSTKIGKGTIVYYNVIITHDCIVGDFVELSPSATLLGHVQVGDYSQVGASAVILPKIKVGKNVTIGAGAVVTKDVPDNAIVTGVPAKIIKFKEPLIF
ncbi:acetyltransferase [Flavobacterium terrae]|uniref:Sugar O-acyltransferase, sialic acid O-acetyltransferase NeuD family n=1 Tax=Flavobacterium terrae TaxID=415425 RepID=A0A1M6CR45_9FLAO|nr:acetyltransferase [Flavobacterium terrae]SHI63456.1 sugar O-acyltransferase, sialic acid O-acetyltransferase NeuD family [Flavobacterium terrae]